MKIRYTGESCVSLTNNKIYEVFDYKYGSFQILDDTNEKYYFSEDDFEIIEEVEKAH